MHFFWPNIFSPANWWLLRGGKGYHQFATILCQLYIEDFCWWNYLADECFKQESSKLTGTPSFAFIQTVRKCWTVWIPKITFKGSGTCHVGGKGGGMRGWSHAFRNLLGCKFAPRVLHLQDVSHLIHSPPLQVHQITSDFPLYLDNIFNLGKSTKLQTCLAGGKG